MDINPFDQFGDEFRSALPSAPAPAAPAPYAAPPATEPPKPKGPVMNAPRAPAGMNGYGQGGGMMNGGGMMYGQPPPGGMAPPGGMGMAPPGGMYGQPPPQQYGAPAPPGAGPPPLGGLQGAMVPSATQSNPYGAMLGGPPPGAPGAPQANGWGAPPPQMGGMAPPPQMGGPPPPQMGGYGAPPPGPPPAAPPAAPPAPQGYDDPWGNFGAPPAPPAGPPVPGDLSSIGSGPYTAAAPPTGAPPPPSSDPFGAPAPPTEAPPSAPPGGDFGDLGPPPPPAPLVPPPTAAPPNDGGFGGLFDAPAPAAPAPPPGAYDDPWGNFGAPPAPPAEPAGPPGQIVPSQPSADDPFGIFGGGAPAVPAPPPAPVTQAPAPPAALPPGEEDMWGDMGFGAPEPAAAPAPAPVAAQQASAPAAPQRQAGELPPGGEWYDARIFTPTLGVMFFKPQELTDSLFLQTDPNLVAALEERPVVAFIVEGSSARSAGVELGHVLLKVNGIDVKNPKEASRLIKEGPRPLPLLFYVPDTTVVVSEGEHMVKYDTRETGAPPSAKDWKPKYVVIGGIIAQPWMMNMYRSKSEYDIAVIETQARRPVSVKVKQFSLQGARIQNDWQGPQMVKYKNKLHPWKFIVVLPVSRNPIKISSPNLSQLKPVHEGIRRVLMAQQRDRGHGPTGPTAQPVQTQGDPYSQGGQNGGHHGGHQGGHQPVQGGVSSARRRQQF